MKILVVDDEMLLVKGIRFNLQNEGYEVITGCNGLEAVSLVREQQPDLVVLDVMMPEMDGLTACSKIREFSDVPIIMLTAKGEDMDKILGLEYGADDYITKPFNILEVKARIKAILRRNGKGGINLIQVKGLTLDKDSRRVFLQDKEISLTAKETDLLELLLTNPGKVYSREKLLNIVWGYDYPGDARTVDVHVRRLREKLEENPAEPEYVFTKWGVGYYFKG